MFRLIICGLIILLSTPCWPQHTEFKKISTKIDSNTINNIIESAKLISASDPDSAESLLQTALKTSIINKYPTGIRKSYYELTALSHKQKKYPQAIHYGKLTLQNCNEKENRDVICEALLYMGLSYQYSEYYHEAIEMYQKALYYTPDNVKTSYIYENISVVMSSIGQWDKALIYNDKALAANPNSSATPLFNRAHIYANINDFQNALLYYDSSYKKATNVNEQAAALSRKWIFFNNSNKTNQALEDFNKKKSILSNDSINSEKRFYIYVAVGRLYATQKRYTNAKEYLLKAKELSKSATNNDKRALMHDLAKLYYATQEYKKAYDMHYLSHKMEDSIKKKEVIVEVHELETKYRTVQKDKELVEQKLEANAEKAHRSRERILGGGVIAGLIIFLLLLLLRYYYLKQKNLKLISEKEIEHLQARLEGEEKERTRLSHELHDGVNSTLATTIAHVQILERRLPAVTSEDSFLKIKELLDASTAEVRSVAHNLAPHILVNNGLYVALETFCYDLFPEEVELDLQMQGEVRQLPKEKALLIYRIAQELLHNIQKHARANEVHLHAHFSAHELHLRIWDNGIGMHTSDKKDGIGLHNIKEKLALYGGNIDIQPVIPQGTLVNITLDPG